MIGLTYIIKLEGMTTIALADILMVTAPAITQWEKKNRTIPKNRLDQLHKIFPVYPIEYFQKDIDEKDALKLQNLMLSHRIDLLRDKDDIDSIRISNALKRKKAYNEHLLERQQIINQVKDVFEKSYELSQSKSVDLMMRNNMIENFLRFCSLQERIIQLAGKRCKADTEVGQQYKTLIDGLENQICNI